MTDNAQAEMVGRLRNKHCCNASLAMGNPYGCNCGEAADALERMAGEMAALREALRPFAKLADFLDEQPDLRWQNPHDEFQCGDLAYSIGVGEVQIARQALATSMAQGQGIDPAPAID